jgi:hypothetical protein
VINMRDRAKEIELAEERAAPANSEGRPPYTDPLPGPDVATPDDTLRPELPPRHMIDDPEQPGNDTSDLRNR